METNLLDYNKTGNNLNKGFLFKECIDFLEKNNHLSIKQKLGLIPIILPVREYNKLKDTFLISAKKLKQLYSLPAMSLAYTIVHKGISFQIIPAYYLYQWQDFLIRETGIVLPLNDLTPSKYQDKIKKHIKFGVIEDVKENLSRALFLQTKVLIDNKLYYYYVNDQSLIVENL